MPNNYALNQMRQILQQMEQSESRNAQLLQQLQQAEQQATQQTRQLQQLIAQIETNYGYQGVQQYSNFGSNVTAGTGTTFGTETGSNLFGAYSQTKNFGQQNYGQQNYGYGGTQF